MFKVNLFVYSAGRRLDQRSRRMLAVVSLPSFVASGLEKPLLAGYPITRHLLGKFKSWESSSYISGVQSKEPEKGNL